MIYTRAILKVNIRINKNNENSWALKTGVSENEQIGVKCGVIEVGNIPINNLIDQRGVLSALEIKGMK